MKIITQRLELIPLTIGQFKLLFNNPDKLAKELNLNKPIKKLNKDTKFAMNWLYKQCIDYPKHHIWYTNWQIILKSENIAIGNFCFKGEPDINGDVEIGYEINEEFQNKKYMTETIDAICKYISSNKYAKRILAETNKDNFASQKILQNQGFDKYREDSESYWWNFKIGQ